MATVNKNFVIKNGLVVQGSTATINGNSILTENAGDAYILNLVGGATLVKSVDSVFTVDQAGNLTLKYGTGLTKTSNNLVIDRSTVDTWYDASGSAASAQAAAESYADSQISSAITTLGNQTSTDISDAITTAENYTDAAISQEVTDRNNAISSALTTAENYADQVGTAAENYADMAATNAENAAKSYADGLASNYDPAGSAATAQSNAESYADSAVSTHNSQTTNVHGIANTANLATKSYADNAASSAQSAAESYADGVATTAENNAKSYADSLASNYDPAGSANNAYNNALADANTYTDGKVSDLVNSAPAMLDTLGELATALQNNPDVITNIQNVAAGKQDTLTAGEGIYIDNNNVITGRQQSGGGLKFVFNEAAIDRSTVDSWYDPSGAAASAQSNAESYADNAASNAQNAAQSYADGVAATAQSNAENYADSLAVNYDAAGSAATAQSNANSYTDNAISSGNVTAEPQYKGIKYSWYSEDTANYAWANSDSVVTAMSWSTNYASAKVLVRLRNGNHSQISEVLITLDSSNNIHMTEYAVVTTNGSLGDISANVSGGNVNLLVTPTHNTGTDIVTHATLMAWGD